MVRSRRRGSTAARSGRSGKRARVDRLLADGAISGAEWTAAIAYRGVYETAFGSLTHSKLADIGNGRTPLRRAASPAPGECQLAAVGCLKQVAAELGGVAYGLLELCIVEDLPWSAIGRRLRVAPKTARSWSVLAIKALAAIR
jgi:hypothetical protein